MSIRLRLVWLAVLIIVPAVIAAIWVVVSTYEREQRSVQRTLRETARALALVVDRELSRREAVVRALATSPSLARGDYAAFDAQARAATAGVEDWVGLIDRQGRYVNTGVPYGTPLMFPQLDIVPFITSGSAVSNLFYGRTIGGPAVTVYTAVAPHDAKGRVYNLHLSFRASALNAVLRDQAFPPGWIAAIFDRNGVVVARQPDSEHWAGRSATPDLARRLQTESEGYIESRSLDGVAATAFFSKSPRYGWAFVIGVPHSILRDNVQRSVQEVTLVAALLIALAIIAAIVVGRSISRPAERLGAAARRFEETGQFGFEDTGVPEIDSVGAALRGASERIRSASQQLQEEVSEAIEKTKLAQQRLANNQRLEALGRLTGGVAHDVNNLLAVITNSAYLLERLVPEARESPQIAAIQRAVDTGRTLTRKLLAFSRRRSVQPEIIEMQNWLGAAHHLLSTSLSGKVELRVEVAPDTAAIRVDASELELALVNLVINAGDAMPDGGNIEVRARNAAPGEAGLEEPMVVISVTDEGVGMPEEVASRAFEPFFTTKAVGKGSGLGLSQVYGMCVQSGGTAQIDTRPGGGTTISMYLPASNETPAAKPGQGAVTCDGTGKLLYVEDNAELAGATRAVLESFGYEVHHAPGAPQALVRLEAESFDLVLSDVVMPGAFNGIELATRIRRRWPRLPVLLMTGYASQIHEAHNAGFEVLQKPLAPQALAAALERAASGRS